jgi:hypothetical protein
VDSIFVHHGTLGHKVCITSVRLCWFFPLQMRNIRNPITSVDKV